MEPAQAEGSKVDEPERQGTAHLRFGMLFVLLSAFWLILSGRASVQYLIIMVLAVGAVALFNLNRFHRARAFSPVPFFRYLVWMLYSITKANFQVARMVLHPRMPIDPVLLEFRTEFRRNGALALLANSITLTPGTVTVDLQNRRYVIHVLAPATAEALLSGEAQARVGAVFAEAPEGAPAVRWIHAIEELQR